MSSLGQAVGGVIGATVGFFTGNPLYGAQIGMMIGGAIDPPKGPTVNGPRLEDLNVQTATYGAFIPRNYGTVAQQGNVFWVQGDRLTEVQTTTTSGGKGGPESTTNTWSYFATFAVGLCKGPIDGVRRIWIGGQIWYDAGSSDFDAIVASNRAAQGFTLYLGSDTQTADPLIQADKGVDNVSAHRGLAYIVFDNLPLEKYGNSLMGAQVKVEIVKIASYAPAQVRETSITAAGRWIDSTDVMACGNPYDANGFTNYIAHHSSTSAYPLLHRVIAGSESLTVLSDEENPLLPSFVPLFPTSSRMQAPSTVSLDTLQYAFLRANQYIVWGKDGSLDAYATFGTCLNCTNFMAFAESAGVIYLLWGYGVSDMYLVKIDTASGEGYSAGLGRLKTHSASRNITGTFVRVSPPVIVVHGEDVFVLSCYPAGTGLLVVRYSESSGSLVEVENYTLPLPTGFLASTISYGNASASIENGKMYIGFSNAGTVFNVLVLDIASQTFDTVYSLSKSSVPVYYNISMRVVDGVIHLSNSYSSIGLEYYSSWGLDVLSSNPDVLSNIVETECLESDLIDASDLDVTELTDTVRGYRVSQQGAIRGALDPLRAAWPFDVIQHGYKIKFKRRGSASVATIPSSLLDARAAGNAHGVQITDSREMDLQLPRRVDVKYLDSTREYDINEQLSPERTSTDSANIRKLDLPIVFTAAEAAQKAETLLYLYWMERNDVSLRLPPEYSELEPGDVITVTSTSADYELRLVSTNTLPDGRIECAAKYNKATIYTPVARGEEGQSTGGLMTISGPAVYSLLDIPLMRDDDDTAGFPVAMAGYLSGWPGGVLYRSDDGGQTWADLRAFTPGAVIGYATTTLTAHGGTVIDYSSTLSVRLYAGTLSSVSQAQLFSGQNWFAYGAHGRWEIIAAANCVLQGDGSYVLSDFLRGQRGTEWATGLHTANDRIVLLNAATLAFISVNSSTIGTSREYRAITTGAALSSDPSLAFTYTGVNLECLSPVALTGNRHPSTNDWTLAWTRRSRYADWRDYIDAPLGETSESYEVDVYSDGTYTTLKRTLTSSSTNVAYTSAQQVTDFGSNQATLYLKVYQISATVGRGYALTQSITR